MLIARQLITRMLEFREMFSKSKADRRFEILDERLLDIQGRVGKIRQSQHEQAEIARDRFTQLLQAINNFSGKVGQLMATQEERLQGIQSALTGIADGINTLQQQVADLKAGNPQLDDEISSIEATVKSIADDINGVTDTAGTSEPDTGAGG